MSLQVVVLLDGGHGLAPTVRSLHALPHGLVDEVCFLVTGPGPKLLERLQEVVDGSAGWRVASVPRRGRAAGAREVLRRTTSTHVVVVPVGGELLAEGLRRMALLHETSGAQAVVGRHSGASLRGLLRDAVELEEVPVAPVPVLSAAVDVARAAAVTEVEPEDEAWLGTWQGQALAAAATVGAVVERPALAGLRLPSPEWLHPLRSRATWDGGVLQLEVSCPSAPSTGQPSLATWRMLAVRASDGDEILLDSSVAAHEGWRDVSARLDVASLPDGAWRPAVEMVHGAVHGRGPMRCQDGPDLVVGGRPVVTTRLGDYLEVQVGEVRRPVVRVDPGSRPVVLDDGRLSLGLLDLEVVGETPGRARVTWAGEHLEAVVRARAGEVRLELDPPTGVDSAPVTVLFGGREAAGAGVVMTRSERGEVSLAPLAAGTSTTVT
ncbi:hypothetical protein ASG49_00915 [Marmoricola sp. Leaf446]|uniref:hypothetical protein n=1 Tax=Marmoricola sp. Leaf446 TaxID=1736379 RepID=UPI0006FFB975|nr:hypothetical protein [Marmoricola sp. Leaf446]KQT93597.1 hypothetical protein ASG49_00915 [Marmoricola sp. Leaf446]